MLGLFKKLAAEKSAAADRTQRSKACLQISGMHCTGCSMNIDGELEDLDGVVSSTTSYAQSRCAVVFDPTKVGVEQLTTAIARLGYRAQVISE